MKVMTVVGTRPELIRLSRVIPALDAAFDHVLAHTGQNWDYGLNGVFFEELQIREPDFLLDVDTTSLGSVLGDTLRKTEEIIRETAPDAFLVLGDTNSAISAVMAKRMHVPVFHMEAGNRCFDENVPEETNRRLVDHIADFNLVYTEHARRNLLAEGIHPRRVMLTGSPMREVLDYYRPSIEASDVLVREGQQNGDYLVVSAHREENVDSPERLDALLRCVASLHARLGHQVFVSTHPRTRNRMTESGLETDLPGVRFCPPFGFFDYIQLQANAFCVVSDSGTISEESAILGFPAVSLRPSIERPEALDTGTVVMADLDPDQLLAAVAAAVSPSLVSQIPAEYGIRDTSVRVRNFILSVAPQHRFWSGLR